MMAERLQGYRMDVNNPNTKGFAPGVVRELLDHIAQLEAQRGGSDLVELIRRRYPRMLERGNLLYDGVLDDVIGRIEAGEPMERGGAVVVPDDTCPRVEQSVLHVPGVSRGNCFSATVAGLLKLPIESIPQFAATDDKSWQEQFNEWLRQFGLAWFPMAGDDLAGECQQFGIRGLWAEMSGKSPRFDVGHSCAAKDGRLAWDPHPSQSGLEHPIWWHGVFLALKPWEAVSRMADLRFANCKLCGHPLKDNDHGFDQCDADVNDNGELVHSGRCTYCKECRIQPIPADRVLADGMVGVDREEWEVTSKMARTLANWYNGHEINRTIWPPELQRYRAIDALRAQQAKGE